MSFLGAEFLKPQEDVHVDVFRSLFPCERVCKGLGRTEVLVNILER